MASREDRNRTPARERPRGLLPVGLIVLVYLLVGTLWVLGSGPVADAVTEITSVPRWVVELTKGVSFVAVTAVVLQVLLRRRDDHLGAAATAVYDEGRRLTASEDRNRLQATALSGTANGVMISARDGTIEWVNEAFQTMSGYPSSVLVGSTPRLLSAGAQDEAFFRDLWETILAGRVWRGEVVNRRYGGELYTVSQTITPVVGEDGGIQNFVAIHEDITERVRAVSELEASRVRLQSLFDHALDAIVLADDSGRYIAVNPAVCELTGYSRDELLELGPADLAAPDQQPAVAVRFERFIHQGTESGTFALRHRDGHIVETEYRAVANVQPGTHLSVLRDVTARNTMMRALTVAEAEFRELAENAADIVAKLRIDGDGRMLVDYVNGAADTILGYPNGYLSENPELLLELLGQRSAGLDDVLDLLPTPAQPTTLVTVQVKRADGCLLWLEIHSTLTDPDTTPVTIQLVARDVTARSDMTQALELALHAQLEAAEQLRALHAMKDIFLQNVSHELRTPLTSILGFAQLLADPRHGLSPADTRDLHRRILSNARQLQQLLDDLMDVDRFTRGHLEANRLPTDLNALIERAVAENDLGNRRVELDLEPVHMDLDAPAVERILANLLANIVRHTPPDAGVWISTRTTAEGVEITVDDDGPGIPAPDRQRVIEPFQQGAGSAFSARPGTGIGLSLADTFARLHGGALAITDSPAGGTRVAVTLLYGRTDAPLD